MKYCGRCHVHIENPREFCPLCQNSLTDETPEIVLSEDFPNVKSAFQKHRFLLRLLAFLSLIGVAAAIIVNLCVRQTGLWSLIVIAATLYFWITVLNLLRTRNSLGGIARSALLISALFFLIDYLYGFSRWSVNYVIPAVLLAAIISVITLSVIRGRSFADFVLYVLITSFSALLTFFFFLTGLATVIWPSTICSICGFLSLIGIFIFADRDILDEIRRRFHV